MGPATVRRAVETVLLGERARPATAVSVTFLSASRMRELNRRVLKRDRVTDVIAFGLSHAGGLAADIYVCPAAARAAGAGSSREELVRLVVHGTLHATGRVHPEGAGRERSAMWRRQEGYVRRLMGR